MDYFNFCSGRRQWKTACRCSVLCNDYPFKTLLQRVQGDIHCIGQLPKAAGFSVNNFKGFLVDFKKGKSEARGNVERSVELSHVNVF